MLNIIPNIKTFFIITNFSVLKFNNISIDMNNNNNANINTNTNNNG